jgi:hypothetical protein
VTQSAETEITKKPKPMRSSASKSGCTPTRLMTKIRRPRPKRKASAGSQKIVAARELVGEAPVLRRVLLHRRLPVVSELFCRFTQGAAFTPLAEMFFLVRDVGSSSFTTASGKVSESFVPKLRNGIVIIA